MVQKIEQDGPEIGQLQTVPVSGWYLEARKAQWCFNVSRQFQQDLKSTPPVSESLYGTDQDIRWGWGPSLLVLPDRSTKECPVLANAQMSKCPISTNRQPFKSRSVCEMCHKKSGSPEMGLSLKILILNSNEWEDECMTRMGLKWPEQRKYLALAANFAHYSHFA